jgi:hypothetical protein
MSQPQPDEMYPWKRFDWIKDAKPKSSALKSKKRPRETPDSDSTGDQSKRVRLSVSFNTDQPETVKVGIYIEQFVGTYKPNYLDDGDDAMGTIFKSKLKGGGGHAMKAQGTAALEQEKVETSKVLCAEPEVGSEKLLPDGSLNIVFALRKIAPHFRKDKKFAKASELFAKLIGTEITVENSQHFYDALSVAVQDERRVHSPALQRVFEKMLSATFKKLEFFEKDLQPDVSLWVMSSVVYNKFSAALSRNEDIELEVFQKVCPYLQAAATMAGKAKYTRGWVCQLVVWHSFLAFCVIHFILCFGSSCKQGPRPNAQGSALRLLESSLSLVQP